MKLQFLLGRCIRVPRAAIKTLAQTGGLKITNISSHSLEAVSPRSSCWQGHGPSEAFWKGPIARRSPSFCRLPAVLGIPGPVGASL